MNLADTVVFAALEALTGVLPLSDSGHQLVARMWLGDSDGIAASRALSDLGCMAALSFALRKRLGRALSEGLRGIARPAVLQGSSGGRDAIALVLAALAATSTETLLASMSSPLNAMPLVVGLGLMLSALSLISTIYAPAPKHTCPSGLGALAAGLAHGLAIVPGASQVGAAFVTLRWLGLSSWNAAETALLITVPVLGFRFAHLLTTSGTAFNENGAMGGGQMVLSVVDALVCATIAISCWRSLADSHRTPWLVAWLLPLSLAVLAYDRALPAPLVTLTPRPPAHAALCPAHERSDLRGHHGGRLGNALLARFAQGPTQAAAAAGWRHGPAARNGRSGGSAVRDRQRAHRHRRAPGRRDLGCAA